MDRPLLASAKKTPTPSPQGGGSEQAVVKHEKSCPKCFGNGLDAFGKPCNYVRPVEPVVHTSGIKKWDATTSTWVDTVPRNDPFTVGCGVVHLSDGTTVTDGDPSVHWGEIWNDIELENEGIMVH